MEPFSNFSPLSSHLSICYYGKTCTKRNLKGLEKFSVSDRIPFHTRLNSIQGLPMGPNDFAVQDRIPFLTVSVLNGFYCTTNICTGGGSRRAHARHLRRSPPRPSYSLPLKSLLGICRIFRVWAQR
uniref:Uncharacterized protein n=2 Tax=Araneus ventricosus TaxID=182803 RepID=A0A4Y2UX98_ARAVE|nr:hypothetical protein AVEN_113374-1 [Araneus ventricosus]